MILGIVFGVNNATPDPDPGSTLGWLQVVLRKVFPSACRQHSSIRSTSCGLECLLGRWKIFTTSCSPRFNLLLVKIIDGWLAGQQSRKVCLEPGFPNPMVPPHAAAMSPAPGLALTAPGWCTSLTCTVRAAPANDMALAPKLAVEAAAAGR